VRNDATYLQRSLGDLLDDVGAPTPTPGSGSVAALVVALAAAVVGMAARMSRSVWDEAGGSAAQAETLRLRAAELAHVDAARYEQALEMRAAPSQDRPERRDFALGRAFAKAAEPPLEIVQAAADVALLACEVAQRCDPAVRADAAAAASLAAGAAGAAAELVAVNLTALEGDQRVGRARRLADEAADEARRALGST